MLEIKVDTDYTFTLPVNNNGIDITLATANVSIYDYAGNAIIDNVSATITAGYVSYTFSASDNDTLGDRFICSFNGTYGGDNYPLPVIMFMVCKYPLVNDVTDNDIFNILGSLRNRLTYNQGLVGATSTTTSITDTNVIDSNYTFIGGRIVFYDSNYIPYSRTITDYDSATGKITFTPAVASAPLQGSKYSIRYTLQGKIDTAFDDVQRYLRGMYGFASNIIDTYKIKHLVIYKAICLILADEMNDREDVYADKLAYYRDEYNKMLSEFNTVVDTNNDGIITNEETRLSSVVSRGR